jgi:hypothetical protein
VPPLIAVWNLLSHGWNTVKKPTRFSPMYDRCGLRVPCSGSVVRWEKDADSGASKEMPAVKKLKVIWFKLT